MADEKFTMTNGRVVTYIWEVDILGCESIVCDGRAWLGNFNVHEKHFLSNFSADLKTFIHKK